MIASKTIFRVCQWWRNAHDALEIKALRRQRAELQAAHKASDATLRAIREARTARIRAALGRAGEIAAAIALPFGSVAFTGLASMFPDEAEAATQAASHGPSLIELALAWMGLIAILSLIYVATMNALDKIDGDDK